MSHVVLNSGRYPTLKLGRLWFVWSRTKRWDVGKSTLGTMFLYYYVNLGRLAIAWWCKYHWPKAPRLED